MLEIYRLSSRFKENLNLPKTIDLYAAIFLVRAIAQPSDVLEF